MSHMFKNVLCCSFIFGLMIITSACGSRKSNTKTITPSEIDAQLVNPGRGFTTTGQTFNEDIKERRHPQSGVVQMRWYWDDIEPKEGKIRFAFIDSMIAEAQQNGQQLNFRIMSQNKKMRTPQWVTDKGAEKPYYKDPVFFDEQADLIHALAERYDGNPNIAFVDIGSLGQWGEWHSTLETAGIEMPSKENQKRIIDLYTDSFKETPLLMLIGGNRNGMLEYAIDRGAGWRADCWGDMGTRWGHMEGFYADALSSSNVRSAWKNAPIALETCWTMDKWYEEGWDIDYILSKALEWHATSVNNGSQEIPQEWWNKVKDFEKKLGYRFVLDSLTFSTRVQTGINMPIDMKWRNEGVAPIYHQYPLAFRFQSVEDPTTNFIVKTEEDITSWMPGNISVSSELQIPDEMMEGKYEMAVGLLQPETQNPAIKLAIEGKTEGGWYSMGVIQIVQ